MPRRGNRKASLSERLANHQPRGIVPPEEIPGTQAWGLKKVMESTRLKYDAQKEQESFFTTYSVKDIAEYKKLIPRTLLCDVEADHETLIDNINRWVDGNGWQYIEGGEYDGSWVNPRYPNRIFSGTSRTLKIRGGISETVVFPVSHDGEDPIGLACHFKVSNAGTRCNIKPNRWTNYDSTRKGRRWAKFTASAARRFKRWEAYQEAEKISNPMKRQNAICALKTQFLSEDIRKEHAEMDYDSDNL